MNAGHDLDDRDEQLETLLRRTFAAQAQTVQDGPRWAGATGRRRSFVLAVAAAVVAVLSLAAAFAVYQGHSDGPSDAAGPAGKGGKVALPTAWRKVITGGPLRVDGLPAVVLAITPGGDLIASVTDGRGIRIVATDARGMKARTLYRAMTGRRVVGLSTDGRYVVLATQADDPLTGTGSPASTVVSIDLHDGVDGGASVLSTKIAPTGSITIGEPELVNGVVYNLAAPADDVRAASPRRLGKGRSAPYSVSPTKHAVVVAYVLDTGRHRVVGKAHQFESYHDGRGVFWASGHRRSLGVPGEIPPFRSVVDSMQRVARNGPTWAWDPNNDGSVVRWTDGSIDRAWHVRVAAHPGDGRGTISAVSGPYVFLGPYDGSHPHQYVLDTRTGAYADLGIDADSIVYEDAFHSGGDTVSITYDSDATDDKQRLVSVVLDLRALPGLSR